MSITAKAVRIGNWLFGFITSLTLGYLYLQYGFPQLSKRWWAIIFLSIFSIFLLFLVWVIKRFHERTVKELNIEHESEAKTRQKHITHIERLTYVRGMAFQAHYEVDSGQTLPKEILDYLDANINQTLWNCFNNPELMEKHYAGLKPIPTTGDKQRWWLEAHLSRLNEIIERERQQSIARKTAIQKK